MIRRRQIQVLREVFRITEYRNGDVYKTEKIGDDWIDLPESGQPIPPNGYQYVTKSSDYDGLTIRTVFVDGNDYA